MTSSIDVRMGLWVLGCLATGAIGLPAADSPDAATLGLKANEAALVIHESDREVLTYHKAEADSPAGADPLFRRSGFIHPIRTPAGATVTGTRPDDHLHHMGLWHAWVETSHAGQKVDFWNLKKGEGTVRFVRVIELDDDGGDGRVGFVVEQAHVRLDGEGDAVGEKVILSERLTVAAARVEGAYEIDYETVQSNVTDQALELPAYRYGGPIAYRAPHHWKLDNSDYLSSEGKTRVDGHQTRSKWIAMSGPGEETGTPALLAILCHPDNHDFPQRMRVWPPETHGGAIFFNYVPIQEKPWSIAAGESVTMRYRLVVSDSAADAADMDRRWNRYETTETKLHPGGGQDQ